MDEKNSPQRIPVEQLLVQTVETKTLACLERIEKLLKPIADNLQQTQYRHIEVSQQILHQPAGGIVKTKRK